MNWTFAEPIANGTLQMGNIIKDRAKLKRAVVVANPAVSRKFVVRSVRRLRREEV